MPPETPPEDADAGLRDRFAALFERFAASEGGRANSADAAYLLSHLQAVPGARILCCDRSVITFGWALRAAGCAIDLLSREEGTEPADGAVCSAEALTAEPLAAPCSAGALLAVRLRPGAHLVVTGAPVPTGGCTLPPAGDFGLLGRSVLPGWRRFTVWTRVGSE